MMEKIKMENKTGCRREEDNVEGICRRGALAGTPAASPMWVFAQANPMHAHLQRLGLLLLLLDCSGARRLCIHAPIQPYPLWLRTGLHNSDFT